MKPHSPALAQLSITLTLSRLTILQVTGSWARASLVPRPHPLTRRDGLVNQVEFLGLVGALATL